MHEGEHFVTVLGEFRGGCTVSLKYFGGFTVFRIPLRNPPHKKLRFENPKMTGNYKKIGRPKKKFTS